MSKNLERAQYVKDLAVITPAYLKDRIPERELGDLVRRARQVWESMDPYDCEYYLTRDADSSDPVWSSIDDQIQAAIPRHMHCYESLCIDVSLPRGVDYEDVVGGEL